MQKNEETTKGSEKKSDVINTLSVVHQAQTRLLVLADQKANILIGVIAVVFTVLLTKLEFVLDAESSLLSIIALFLIFEAGAIILALIVIVPKNIHKKSRVDSISQTPNILFFGFFTEFKEDEYMGFLLEKMHNNTTAQELLIRDFYQVGHVLKRKYLYLKYSYTLAILGIFSLILSAAVYAIWT